MSDIPDISPLPEPDGEPVAAVDDDSDTTHGGGSLQDIRSPHGQSGKLQDDQPSTPHDPALHESPPRVVTRAGAPAWAKRRGGVALKDRQPGSIGKGARSKADPPAPRVPVSVESGGPTPTTPATPTLDASASAQVVGAMAAGAFVTLCQLIGGDEFAPVDNEQAVLNQAAGDFCESSGIVDLPPGVALAMVAAVFVAKRWNAPKFAAKRQQWTKKFRKDKDPEQPAQ